MNLTSRARFTVAVAATGTAAGLLSAQEPLALLGLILLAWFGLEAANFWIRTQLRTQLSEVQTLQVQRLLNGQTRDSWIVSVGQQLEVDLRIQWSPRLRGLRLQIEEVLPFEIELTEGSKRIVTEAWRPDVLHHRYLAKPVAAGQFHLPGVTAVVSDAHGLFRQQVFIRLPVQVTVLPFQIRPKTTVSILKDQNVQMMTGSHRFRRPGFSTELLEIRDYQPGDSPRSIAWKATARLDRLMTCEYESETPMRATILTELSPSLFAGPPAAAPAQRVIAASGGIARFLLADGDPIAALLATGQQSIWIPHGAGERHLTRLLLRLVSIRPQPSLAELYTNTLLSLTWHAAFRRYPGCFDSAINAPVVPWYLWGSSRKRAVRRKQLCLLLSQLYPHLLERTSAASGAGIKGAGVKGAEVESDTSKNSTAPGSALGLSARLEYDDRSFIRACRQLLRDHPGLVATPPLSLDPAGAATAHQASLKQIQAGLLKATARARDNELYVLVCSIPHTISACDELLATIRVARGAKHRVVVIDVGPPPHQHLQDETARNALSESVEVVHAHRFDYFKQQLTRLGGRIARLHQPEMIEAVAAEVEILKTGRVRA